MPAHRITSLVIAVTALALLGAPSVAARRHPHSAATGSPEPGAYVCEGADAGMFPVTILPEFHYRAAGPAGSYVVADKTLKFTGGSLANNVGTLDGAAAFSLATIGSATPYTHCTRAPTKAKTKHKRR